MNSNELFSGIDILKPLVELDCKLRSPERIILAGSAVPILAGCDFRGTYDIDFAFLPSLNLIAIINNDPELQATFDFNAPGIIGLLQDAEDRLVPVELGMTRLKVERLSLLDWAVSKLASPKLEDVLSVPDVTLDILLEIKHRFHDYCGVSTDRAFADLQYLIAEKQRRDSSC